MRSIGSFLLSPLELGLMRACPGSVFSFSFLLPEAIQCLLLRDKTRVNPHERIKSNAGRHRFESKFSLLGGRLLA